MGRAYKASCLRCKGLMYFVRHRGKDALYCRECDRRLNCISLFRRPQSGKTKAGEVIASCLSCRGAMTAHTKGQKTRPKARCAKCNRLEDLIKSGKWWDQSHKSKKGAQNSREVSIASEPTAKSGYKGVYPARGRSGYIASIGNKGKRIYLGYFSTAIDAAKAYNVAALLYHGPQAYFNQIEES